MKFGATFQDALKRDEYPKEWIDSAISYKKLKKCIKRVQEELLSLGLDHDTLERLWQQVGDSTVTHGHGVSSDNAHHIMHYDFPFQNGIQTGNKFTPKLTIALDPQDGSPMDAWLSPETRRVLRQLGRRQSVAKSSSSHGDALSPVHSVESNSANTSENSTPPSGDHEGELETVEIPLTSDSEFFQILRREIANLAALQRSEQKQMETAIVKLGDNLRELKTSKKKRSREELDAWREIFRLYLD